MNNKSKDAATIFKFLNCKSYIKIILVNLLITFPIISQSIVMRHDVDPNDYLLDPGDYQSAIYLQEGCSATLIAPRWVLTASHCYFSDSLDPIDRGPLVVLGEPINVLKVHIHPGSFVHQGIAKHDFALLELEEPVYTITPTPPYEGNDELNQLMKLVGYGYTGNGREGIKSRCFPCDLRGADNYVAEANMYHLRFKFNGPEDPDSLLLEGVGGPGDSGGPVYIETEDGRFIAGVSSFGGFYYGDHDQYTRVSQELDWMSEVMGEEYPGDYSGPLYSETTHPDPDIHYDDYNDGGSSSGGGSLNLLVLCLVALSRRIMVGSFYTE